MKTLVLHDEIIEYREFNGFVYSGKAIETILEKIDGMGVTFEGKGHVGVIRVVDDSVLLDVIAPLSLSLFTGVIRPQIDTTAYIEDDGKTISDIVSVDGVSLSPILSGDKGYVEWQE